MSDYDLGGKGAWTTLGVLALIGVAALFALVIVGISELIEHLRWV